MTLACRIWGEDAAWRRDARAHPHEAPVLRLDATKARERLGWSCRLTFRETLDWTFGFYRDCAHGDAADLMRSQIDAYLQRAEAVACASC